MKRNYVFSRQTGTVNLREEDESSNSVGKMLMNDQNLHFRGYPRRQFHVKNPLYFSETGRKERSASEIRAVHRGVTGVMGAQTQSCMTGAQLCDG